MQKNVLDDFFSNQENYIDKFGNKMLFHTKKEDLKNVKFIHEQSGRYKKHSQSRIKKEIEVFDEYGKKINFLSKRNFIVKATDLPKQFGFEIYVNNLHYDEDEQILAKNLVQGDTFIKKMFFVFNINDFLLNENNGSVNHIS